MINPFRNRIVADPWRPGGADVTEIHSSAFDLCRRALNTVRKEGRTTSVLLYGETGSGKTHVLNRLQHYTLTLPNLHVFGSVRLHTSPNRLWRHLRASFVESLFKPGKHGRPQIELMLMRRLYLLYRKTAIPFEELTDLTETIRTDSNLSPNLCQALQHLMHQRHGPDVLAWLKGHSLPESAYSKLLIRPPDETDDPEDSAREMILELCRLAGTTIPVVLSFDQIEALQRYPKDIDGLFRFGQAIRTLHDETSNLLLVTCIQTFFLGELRQAVAVPDFDAMSCHELTLGTLTRQQALKLISSRIEAIPDKGFNKNALFQMLENDLSDFAGETSRTCRAVLTRCADIFDNLSSPAGGPGQPVPELPLDAFLQNELDAREESAFSGIGPDEMDDMLSNVLPSLVNILDEHCREKDRHDPDVDMVIACPDAEIGISLCNHQNLSSLAGKLRRLAQNFTHEKGKRLVLLRHPQLRISPGARKVNQYLRRLSDRGIRLVTPSPEALAALDALRSLLSDARSGDLTHQGKPVHEKTVREWFKSLKAGSAKAFMDDVLSESDPISPEDQEIRQRLLELMEKERIIALSEAARRIHIEVARLEPFVMNHIREIGYLEGPPAVLFDVVP
ncbi:MAG: ATP-binding protein [Deltaproteobacteria bacterium]|nr:ATP-binding protein [Deltaproteobacteria bacterium]